MQHAHKKIPVYHETNPELGDLRFRRLLTDTDWETLPKRVRNRFSQRLAPGESKVYTGHIVETRMSRLGRLFAHALRPIGAPLPLDTDNDGEAAVVTVTECPQAGGQFWTRQYNRKDGFPQIVHSAKSFAGPTGLQECVGGGFGMTLLLSVLDQELLFKSDTYFLKWFGLRIPIPRFLTPGTMTIGHEDIGGGWFHFTLELKHKVFGTLIHQRAAFRDMYPTTSEDET